MNMDDSNSKVVGGSVRPVDTNKYRQAVLGNGDLADVWKQSPSLLVYDLASEVDHLRVQAASLDRSHKPEIVTYDQLADLLLDLAQRVRTGDSFEGFIEYLMPEEGGGPQAVNIRAAFRVGNRAGQGGMRFYGFMEGD